MDEGVSGEEETIDVVAYAEEMQALGDVELMRFLPKTVLLAAASGDRYVHVRRKA
jgi:hypothetical protein